MKTELLTFQTTVRIRYDAANPRARAAAMREARFLLNELAAQSHGRQDDRGTAIEVETIRAVYRPKVPYQAPYRRMDGVDR